MPWPRPSTACTRPSSPAPRGPWRTVEQVEVATAEWVDWFNYRRLYEYNSDLPPAEPEDAYCAQQRAQPVADVSNQ